MSDLLLYSTEDCHLCEQALAIISRHKDIVGGKRRLQVIDIIGDEALMERYGVRIPVLRENDSGREIGWPFDADSLTAFLQPAPDAAF